MTHRETVKPVKARFAGGFGGLDAVGGVAKLSDMEAVRYGAPWDGGLRLLTAFVAAAFAAAVAGAVAVGLRLGEASSSAAGRVALPAIFAALFVPMALLVLFAAFRQAPRAFTVSDAGVAVERRAGALLLPLASIREAALLDPAVSLRRVGAVHGLFGYVGDYDAAGLGRVRLHGTRDTGRVLLRTDSGLVVLTPSDPGGFVAEVRRRIAPPA
jgi:hypothetical protein